MTRRRWSEAEFELAWALRLGSWDDKPYGDSDGLWIAREHSKRLCRTVLVEGCFARSAADEIDWPKVNDYVARHDCWPFEEAIKRSAAMLTKVVREVREQLD